MMNKNCSVSSRIIYSKFVFNIFSLTLIFMLSSIYQLQSSELDAKQRSFISAFQKEMVKSGGDCVFTKNMFITLLTCTVGNSLSQVSPGRSSASAARTECEEFAMLADKAFAEARYIVDAQITICKVLDKSPVKAVSQDPLFKRIVVSSNVSIELPSHWSLRGLDDRRNTAASVEARTGQVQHVATLSAFALPRPSGANVRLSFIDEITTQDDVRKEYNLRKSAFLKDLSDVYTDLIGELVKNGVPITQRFRPEVIDIGPYIVFKFIYERDGTDGRWLVAQYHLVLGPQKILLTTSHRQRDAQLWEPILRRVVQSLRIKS
ncbi:MAG: hypothetical protein Q8R85_07325 [Bosea sp. (in: a-proteobacteria)]|uniref:hypothetical protein n=1 Tax=Bosea sp. (in: a-proteobacteria) TaxID=1871050 RepID=UPI002736B986|nr:hypothetical protein [Bosea sp. (in: a-proteobacteria)]MDP3600955.1 hypothetical protein [Bosea sp. (in: a-proteobacteria)]